jgi:hypothetical protein
MVFVDLSDDVDAEVQALEVGHGKEGCRKDLPDQVPAKVQILQGLQVLEVALSYRLKRFKF